MFNRSVRLVVLMMFGLMLAACGSEAAPTAAPATAAPTTAAQPTTPPAPAESAAIAIKQFAFTPETLEIKSGTTVLWTNSDDIEHSVTSSGGAFDSGLFAKDGTFEFTFTEPGEYPYVCVRHGSMMGKVVVTAP